jgi:protocatechuate 3,4-dioxygenase beta subunit
MRHTQQMKTLRILGLSMTIGLGAILAACSTSPTATPAPIVATMQPTIDASPTALPPTQPAAALVQPTAMVKPTEAAIRPTPGAADAPSCTSPAALTPAQTEGPYYTLNSPERSALIEPGMSGTKLIVTGQVLTTDCQPIAKAWLDFWQADDQGAYDNAGYRLRGHLFTDEQGRYTLETVVPGEYPGRTQHVHVKVRAPNGPILTTQIYFPGAPGNDRDSIFDPALLADVQDGAGGKVATFDFVVKTQ